MVMCIVSLYLRDNISHAFFFSMGFFLSRLSCETRIPQDMPEEISILLIL